MLDDVGNRAVRYNPSAFHAKNGFPVRTLICGSIAYDTIMVFRDRFKNHILPDQMHILNVAFLVPDMRREFGGCAGNIAYILQHAGRRAAHHGDRRRRLRSLTSSA